MPRESDGPILSMPVSDKRDHIQGPATTAVTLVEYGDYECPYCGQAYYLLQKLLPKVHDDVRLVFRNFPLTQMHPNAEHAAEAAEAAAAQGRFWEMHDMLYEHQDALDDDALLSYATDIGLDVDRFRREFSERKYLDRIREDFQSGIRSGVNGTPTFFINGHRHDGELDLESLQDAVSLVKGAHREAKAPTHHRPHA